jgi:hypothetical protein
MGDVTVWGMIDAQAISFPLEVEAFNEAVLMYSVPLAVAQRLMPGDAFELVEIAPGSAQLVIAALDYRKNPWGDYNEIDIAFLARPAGGPVDETGGFVLFSPVNDRFGCEVGHRAVGLPMTMGEIEAIYTADRVAFSLVMDGEPALALRVPRANADATPVRIHTRGYTYIGGEPCVTVFDMDLPGGAVTDLAAVELELGRGAIADTLRTLGLPKEPDYCAWGERLWAGYQRAQPLPTRQPATDG